LEHPHQGATVKPKEETYKKRNLPKKISRALRHPAHLVF